MTSVLFGSDCLLVIPFYPEFHIHEHIILVEKI